MNILNNLKYEATIFLKLKYIIYFLVYIFAIIFIFSFFQFQSLNQSLVSYDNVLKMYEMSGISEEEGLKEGDKNMVTKYPDGTIASVDENPIYTSKNRVTQSLYTISPYYYLQNILEAGVFIFFPLFIIVYAINAYSFDVENRMIMIRGIKRDWGLISACKIIFISLVSILFIFISSLILYLVSIIQYNFVDSAIIDKFMNESGKVDFNIFQNVLVTLFISLIFMLLSIFIFSFTKNKSMSFIIIFVYLFIIPSLGKFDLKNILMNITKHHFPYRGSSGLSNVIIVDIGFCYIFCILLMAFFAISSYYLSKNQNKYL